MTFDFHAKTHTGKVRTENQDSFGTDEKNGLFFVCDGMGGHASGEFASRTAVQIILKTFELLTPKELSSIFVNTKNITNIHNQALKAIAALRLANRGLFALGEKYPKLKGMGTTVATIITDTSLGIVHIFHAGDSRVYRMRDAKLDLLTDDHSKINELIKEGKLNHEEALISEIQSMITRSIGTLSRVSIDYRTEALQKGDVFLICSDGVNGEIEDSVIAEIMSTNALNLERLCRKIIDTANSRGGRDNSTAVAVRINETSTAEASQISQMFFEKPITIPEDTLSEIVNEETILRNMGLFSLKVPKEALEKFSLKNPFVVAILLALISISAFFFFGIHKEKIYETNLTEFTGKIAGVAIEVRTPTEQQLQLYRNETDNIQKLQIVQDWYLNKEATTQPLSGAEVSIKQNSVEVFKGYSKIEDLQMPLQPGYYTIGVTLSGYKVIQNKVEAKETIDLYVENSNSFAQTILILIPDTY